MSKTPLFDPEKGRLIAVSNRTAIDPTARAGGLAVALWDTLVQTKGTWVGWSGKLRDFAGGKLQESAAKAKDDDFIWVHDYHFFLLAKTMRQRGVSAKMGFFLHIPFPAPEIFRALPENDVIGLFSRKTLGAKL